MKVIIPIAGEGRRLRPYTHTKPKPLLRVAGKPIIDHVMDRFLPLQPTEFVFVTGHLGHKLEHHLKMKYGDQSLRFTQQKEINGTATAVGCAREAFDEDILIDFGDTIFDADLSIIQSSTDDAIIWAMHVEDYQRFGVIVTDAQGYMTRIVEKPKEPISKLANIGLYYVKNTKLLEEGIDLVARNRQPGKEAWLTDAFAYMIEKGAKIKVVPCTGWFDCGTAETLLETNRTLLNRNWPANREYPGVTIIPPVAIHPTAHIEGSVIGPFVSIAANAQVRNSTLQNTILDEGAEVQDADLSESILGVESFIRGRACKAIIGDHSRVEWRTEEKKAPISPIVTPIVNPGEIRW